MKLFVVLFLIGVCAAKPAKKGHTHVNFCKNNVAGELLAKVVRKRVVTELLKIIG